MKLEVATRSSAGSDLTWVPKKRTDDNIWTKRKRCLVLYADSGLYIVTIDPLMENWSDITKLGEFSQNYMTIFEVFAKGLRYKCTMFLEKNHQGR